MKKTMLIFDKDDIREFNGKIVRDECGISDEDIEYMYEMGDERVRLEEEIDEWYEDEEGIMP